MAKSWSWLYGAMGCQDCGAWWPGYVVAEALTIHPAPYFGVNNFYHIAWPSESDPPDPEFATLSTKKGMFMANYVWGDLVAANLCDVQLCVGFKGPGGTWSDPVFQEYDINGTGTGPKFATLATINYLIGLGGDALDPTWFIVYKCPYTLIT